MVRLSGYQMVLQVDAIKNVMCYFPKVQSECYGYYMHVVSDISYLFKP